VEKLREVNVTPHVAQNDVGRKSAIDARTTRQHRVEISQRKRTIEEIIWVAEDGGIAAEAAPSRYCEGQVILFYE